MTQEDQLDISHHSNNSVCDQISDDSLTKSNSKNNLATTSGNGDQIIQNDDMSSIVMGAVVVTDSTDNESIASQSPSTSLPSSPDQLTPSSLISAELIKSNKNQDQLTDNNITVRNVVTDNIDNGIQNEEKSLILTESNTDGINCDNENSLKMTVTKAQNKSENIHEILQMKIEKNDKNNETNNINNKIEESYKLENTQSDSGTVNESKEIENKIDTQEKSEENLENISNKNEPLVSEIKSGENFDSESNKEKKIEKENVKNTENSVNCDIGIRKSKRKSKERSISQDIEDPIARLNALKANISNALKEVKAVLIEHGEPVLPEKPEKVENENSDSGAVKFRFVKKVRRRSTFDEDKDTITEIIIDQVVNEEKINEENELVSTPSETVANDGKPAEQSSGFEPKKESTATQKQNQEALSIQKDADDVKSNIESKLSEENTKVKEEKKTDEQSDISNLDQTNKDEAEQTKKIVKKLSPKTKKVKDSEISNTENGDKKPTKKKLVKRNSQDDTSKTSSEGPTKPETAETSKKNEVKKVRKSSIDNNQSALKGGETDSKKKTTKLIPAVNKSVTSAVSTALDKVLATTNLKIPNERRASIAATPPNKDQPSKPALEKRRSSAASRLPVKSNLSTINESGLQNKSSNTKISENVSNKTTAIPKPRGSPADKQNKVEKLGTNQKKDSPSTSLPTNIKNFEKQNVAPSNEVQSNNDQAPQSLSTASKLENNVDATAAVSSSQTKSSDSRVKEELLNVTVSATKENQTVQTTESTSSSVSSKVSSETGTVVQEVLSQDSGKQLSPKSSNKTDTGRIETQSTSISTVSSQKEIITGTLTNSSQMTQMSPEIRADGTSDLTSSSQISSNVIDEIKSASTDSTQISSKSNVETTESPSQIPSKTESTEINSSQKSEKSNTSNSSTSSEISTKATTQVTPSSTNPQEISSKTSTGIANASTTSGQVSSESNKQIMSNSASQQITPKTTAQIASSPTTNSQGTSKTTTEIIPDPKGGAESNSTVPAEPIESNNENPESKTTDSTDANQSESKSPFTRNAITAKLFELKRTSIKMPVVAKPNLEAAKIHPLNVLHITPPKNFSTTTLKKTPQNATVSTSKISKKTKPKKDDDNKEGDEDISGDDVEETTTTEENKGNKTTPDGKKRKSKKVVIRRVKRRLSLDAEEKVPELEVEEKEIQPKTPEPESTSEPEKTPGIKSCLKVRAYEPGELVMYADRVKKVMKWKKATVIERITSISYKLDVEGEEKPAHISYIRKYTDKKVHFGGKEYLEIDYALDEESEEEEEPERYNIWARV